MVTIILYLLCIIASLVMVRFSQMPKKRDYLSLAFDLTIMILLFTWDKEHLVAFISLSLVLVTVFVVLFYFTIIKPAKCANYLDYFRQQEQKDRLKLYLTVMLIIPAIVIKSRVVMFFFLLAYILVERFLFYKKHHSLA